MLLQAAPASNPVTTDVLMGAALALAGLAALAVLVLGAVTLVGFLVRARDGTQLAWGGGVGVVEAVARPLVRVVHRTRWVGFEGARIPEGGFVIVANHASGLDPPLMQFAVSRRVRFLMAQEQMHPALTRFWKALDVLPVTYTPQDAATLREAVRHVKNGGVVGIFPEGGIVRPPCGIAPFKDGSGALIALTRAPVVLLWIHGTPTTGNALLDPLIPRGRAVVELVGIYDFAAIGVRDPKEIGDRLRAELAKASGWPLREG